MRLLFTLLLGLLAFTPGRAAENEIFLNNGGFHLGVPSDWVILAHSPTGNRPVVAFQIFGNPAEIGSGNSTNLAISIFALKDPEAARAAAAPLAKRAQEAAVRTYEGWEIRQWQGEQDGAQYQILDARTVNKTQNLAIHVRLAWPILSNNPVDYEETMNALLKTTLDGIAEKNPEAH